jgi:hypothetical protein
MPSFPRDQFDELPAATARVGAHRAAETRPGWVRFAWAALATGVLVVIGLVVLSIADPSFRLLPVGEDSQQAGPAQTDDGVVPVTDPGAVDPALELSILVLNGTDVADLQTAAGAQLTSVGWPVDSVANASESSEQTTVVYYTEPAFEGVALGLVEQLGVGEVRESQAFAGGSPVTIVLGTDYSPPAG